MKDMRIALNDEIKSESKKALMTISKSAYHKYFEAWKKRWRKVTKWILLSELK